MDTKKILFTLSAALVMNAYADNMVPAITVAVTSGSHRYDDSYAPANNNDGYAKVIGVKQANFVDTARVIGVFNQDVVVDRFNRKKFIQAVTKTGTTYFCGYECSKMDQTNPIVPYIERGDTILINNKGEILKNLTQERLKNEFVKGR